MKKKNLKSLRLQKSTISSLTAQTLHGGTDIITIVIRTVTAEATVTGCSGYMECNSVQVCPKGVLMTRFVNVDTKPISTCVNGDG